MKQKNKKTLKESIIICVLILFMFPLVSSMQDFTYYANKTINISMINLTYQSDFFNIDPWFRYKDYSLDVCIERMITPETTTIDFTTRTLHLDCDEYSLYNFIKYIREKDFELILGNGLDSSEITAANNLANFFDITITNHDSDYNSINDINNNTFIIGNSNKNTLTNELIGTWNYSSGEAIARFIVNNSYVKIVIGGTDSADTLMIINSLIKKTNYYESFTENCIVLEGCDYICYSGDLNCDGQITITEIFYYLEDYSNQKVLESNLNLAIKKWISQT